MSAKLYSKTHHLKRVARECMPLEHLTNAETLSNILKTIYQNFWGEHAPIPLTSAQQYLIYIQWRSGVVGRERMGTVFPHEKFERYLFIIAIKLAIFH